MNSKDMMDKSSVFEASPWKAIASLSIPSLISILVMMLYNMADMYFVGWLDDVSQVAAVSLAMPVFTSMMAISTMIGNGGCTKIAQSLGMDDKERVRVYTALCFWSSIIFGLILTLAVFLFQTPLLKFLGTNEDTFAYTGSYVLFLAAGASFASALRQGILLIPLLYIMNALMGMNGLPASHAVADFISIVVTAGMALRYYRNITGAQLQSSSC